MVLIFTLFRAVADYDDDTNDLLTIEESDNEEDSAHISVNASTSKRRNAQHKISGAKSVKSRSRGFKKGVMWDDDDDDD